MLSNTVRVKLVLDLYNQVKNIRQIAKEARMSFRDINIVLKKAAASLESETNNLCCCRVTNAEQKALEY
jgi:hypothetical protein